MSLSLEGRIAVVTGASRGIGRARALALGDAGHVSSHAHETSYVEPSSASL